MQKFFEDAAGPIESYSWGRFVIDGQEHMEGEDGPVGKGKDIRMVGREVSRWKERKGHLLKKRMVTGVYDQGIKVLIIGTGATGALEVPRNVIESIEQNGIKRLYITKTAEACKIFNALYHRGEAVALLAHGTC